MIASTGIVPGAEAIASAKKQLSKANRSSFSLPPATGIPVAASARRSCMSCGTLPPVDADKCPDCGEEL